MSNKNESQKLNVLDLVCGCGGMSKGLIDSGLNVIAGIDIWDKAINSYQKMESSWYMMILVKSHLIYLRRNILMIYQLI